MCSSFPAGTALDGAHQGELARLVAETVREGGRRSRDAEYSRVLESRGASSRLFLGSARVEFCTEVPAHELPLALWLESGRHGPYAFTQANFDERRQEMSLGRDEAPLATLATKAYALAFPGLGGPRAATGTPLLEQARRFHVDHYRLDRAVLSIAGDFDAEAIRAEVEELFVGAASPPMASEEGPARRQTSPRYMAFEDRALAAPLHARAWAVPGPGTPDHAALEMAAELLAGNSDSILEEMLLGPGIARAVTHRFERRGPEDLLLVLVELASDQNATDLVVLIDQAVQRLAAGPFRQEQLTRARRRLDVARVFTLQKAIERARRLGELASVGANLDADADRAALDAVRPEDVRRAVLAHLGETRRVVVELLPREARDPFRVAAPRFHVVTEGEALSRIARREGTTVSELLRLNELDKKGRIRRTLAGREPTLKRTV